MGLLTSALTLPGLALRHEADDPETWRYRPLTPHPETGPDGEPSGILLVAPDGTATLRLGARLDPGPADLEQARSRAAEAAPDVPLPLVRLVSDVVSVERVALAIVGLGDRRDELASAGTSGFPPWTTLLTAVLDADQAAVVASAMRGGHDLLEVAYELTCADGSTDRVSADVGTWFTAADADHVLLAPNPTTHEE